MRGRLFLLAVILVLSGGFRGQITAAQSPDFLYSENKGHSVGGVFMDYLIRFSNPKIIIGEPITEAFTDPKTTRLVQYFEKAKLEYYPTNPSGQQVQPSPLGYIHYMLVKDQIQPGDVFTNSHSCRSFPDTGLKVCQAFLAFYQANGSEYTFGPPVSNAFWQNGRLVQYFFYSKFEWHPDLPTGKSIQPTNLGYENFYLNKEDPSRLEPIPLKDNSILPVLSLNARAFPEKATTTSQGHQTVHIQVRDQRNLPLAGAQAVIVLRLPSGDESRYIVPKLTDQHGITQFTFPFNSNDVLGMAEIKVIVTRDHLETITTTSYRIWW